MLEPKERALIGQERGHGLSWWLDSRYWGDLVGTFQQALDPRVKGETGEMRSEVM